MYAQIENTAPSAVRPTPSRATLRTRPMNQRMLIRSWDYIRPVRVALVTFRMLVVLWLIGLSVGLMTHGYAWAVVLLPAAAGVAALSAWIYVTATKGWPVDEA
jgi:hypothetical protein